MVAREERRQRLAEQALDVGELQLHVGRPAWLHWPEWGVASIWRNRAFISGAEPQQPARKKHHTQHAALSGEDAADQLSAWNMEAGILPGARSTPAKAAAPMNFIR
jgi:hypothetical protein